MSSGRLARLAERAWYGPRAPLALRPLAWLFGGVVRLRRLAWRQGPWHPRRAGLPVIVVGNITVGGTGKTPVVAWLAELLAGAGYRPGIVSRGYGGGLRRGTHLVAPEDSAALTGDEPLLLRRLTGLPVCIGRDRVAAAARLAASGVDLVIADDGLQHLALARDLEIAVLDGERLLGNGALLPAGPLREPASRLDSVDFVLVNGGDRPLPAGAHRVRVQAVGLVAPDGSRRQPLSALAGQRVRVLAGIGHPERVYRQLAAAGIEVMPLPVGDHGRVGEALLAAEPGLPLLLTAKDAVKYPRLPVGRSWVLEAALEVPAGLGSALLARVAAVAGSPRHAPRPPLRG